MTDDQQIERQSKKPKFDIDYHLKILHKKGVLNLDYCNNIMLKTSVSKTESGCYNVKVSGCRRGSIEVIVNHMNRAKPLLGKKPFDSSVLYKGKSLELFCGDISRNLGEPDKELRVRYAAKNVIRGLLVPMIEIFIGKQRHQWATNDVRLAASFKLIRDNNGTSQDIINLAKQLKS